MFAAYTYLASTLVHVTHVSPGSVPVFLCVFGIGMTVGNLAAPWAADRALMPTAGGLLLWSAASLALYPFAAHSAWLIGGDVLLIGFGVALGAVLQIRLMDVAGDAQSLAAALNHSAFNTANALGPGWAAWRSRPAMAGHRPGGWDARWPCRALPSGACRCGPAGHTRTLDRHARFRRPGQAFFRDRAHEEGAPRRSIAGSLRHASKGRNPGGPTSLQDRLIFGDPMPVHYATKAIAPARAALVALPALIALAVAGPARAQSDPYAMAHTASPNQLGVMEYCQGRGDVGPDAVAAQRSAIARLPASTVSTEAAEALGKQGTLTIPNGTTMTLEKRGQRARQHGLHPVQADGQFGPAIGRCHAAERHGARRNGHAQDAEWHGDACDAERPQCPASAACPAPRRHSDAAAA